MTVKGAVTSSFLLPGGQTAPFGCHRFEFPMKKIIKWLLLASLALGAGQLALASAQAADVTPAAVSATSSADQVAQPTLAELQAKAEKRKPPPEGRSPFRQV